MSGTYKFGVLFHPKVYRASSLIPRVFVFGTYPLRYFCFILDVSFFSIPRAFGGAARVFCVKHSKYTT